MVLYHHEKYDGGGYPYGLKGEDIPIAARIFAVVDAVDAMLYDRPYRKALGFEEVVAELERHAGSHFDPGVVAGVPPAFRSRSWRMENKKHDRQRRAIQSEARR